MLRQDTLMESIMEVANPSVEMDEDELLFMVESLDDDDLQNLDDETLEFLVQYLEDGVEEDEDNLTAEELEGLAEVMASLDEDELSYLQELSDDLLKRYSAGADKELLIRQRLGMKPNRASNNRWIGHNQAAARITRRRKFKNYGAKSNPPLTVEGLNGLAEVMASLDENELDYLQELSDKLLNQYADRADSEIRTMQGMNPRFQPRKRLQKRIRGEDAAVYRMRDLPKDKEGRDAMARMYARRGDHIGTKNYSKERQAGLRDLDREQETSRPNIDRRAYWRSRDNRGT